MFSRLSSLSPSLLALLLLLACAVAAEAQTISTGTVEGLISDASGAVVPGAKVTLINLDTGMTRSASSNAVGRYVFPATLPGRYRVEVSKEGFQQFAQTLRVQTGIVSTVDASLAVGDVKQTTTVSAEGPVIETASANLGAVITNRQVTDLPLAGRNPYMLIFLSPGVIQTRNPGPSDFQDLSGVSYFATNGASDHHNDFLIDGIPNNRTARVTYIASVEQVEEFNVQANTYDAEFGHSAGSVVNVSTRSGTNSYHGSVYEFLRNSALDANNFFNNRSGLGKPPYTFNQFGAAAGGPILRNRLFFYANYEGIRTNNPTPGITTVPTDLQRRGDFSQTFDQASRQVRIYDPFSTRRDPASPARFLRDQFPGNAIPASRFDPVSKNLLSFLPAPNRAGDPVTSALNYAKTLRRDSPMNNVSFRVDAEVLPRNRLFGRASTEQTVSHNDYLIDIGGPGLDDRIQSSVAVGDTFTISPATILDISSGFTRYRRAPSQPDADMAQLGFPRAYIQQVQQQKVPLLSNSDMTGFGASEGTRWDNNYTWSFQTNLRHLRGRHSTKMGFQIQRPGQAGISGGRPAGTFSFDRGFTQGPDPSSRGTNIGHGIASYLVGTPASGYVSYNASNISIATYYGFYFQDDIRLSQRLTLNFGLRYELWLPPIERYDRINTGFAYYAANPIESAARAAYAAAPIPELPADQFRVMGGLTFPSPGKRRNGIINKSMWAPRVGLAYRINNKTVLRAGWGIFYAFPDGAGGSGTAFSTQTPFTSSLDGITPANVLSNPFPEGMTLPVGASRGLATLLGSSLSTWDQLREHTYNKRWSMGFQREVSSDLRLELNYVGNAGYRLPVGTGGSVDAREIHFLPSRYLALGSRLNQTVSNPFFGLIPSGTLAARTISVQNLLMTYPQFSSISVQNWMFGKSWYHSLQLTATKRFARSMQFLSSYTFGKTLERLRFNDASDPAPSKQTGEWDRPHRFTFGGIFEIPIGPGRKWLTGGGPLRKVTGGWQFSVMQVYQTGDAPSLPTMLATGADPWLAPDQRTVDNWFNKAAFVTLPSFTARTLPYRISRLRSAAINNWDASLVKDTVIHENWKAQFRWEVFNLLNRAQFGAPNMNPSSSSYGRVSSQVNSARSLQFGLKLIF